MKQLHSYLSAHVEWYKQWHQHPHHSTVHYVALAVAVLLIGTTTLSSTAPARATSSTNTVVLSSVDPSFVGKSVTLAIAVAPSVSSLTYPSGSVTIAIDGVDQATVLLQKGSAEFPTPSLAAGTHSVIARYNGDSTYTASVSPALTQVVTATWDKPLAYGIDVTKYGIKGDGVTDNTAAFRTMIASFPKDTLFTGSPPGGQRLYFPAGTYLVSDSIDLTRLAEVTLVGDTDVNGNPASTIKATTIATAHPASTLDATKPTVNYYPLIIKDGVPYNGTGPIHMKNLAIAAPSTVGAVGVLLAGLGESSFDNMVFTGYIGIQGVDSVFTSSIRNSKFIGPGTSGSTAVEGFTQLIDSSSFSNWDRAVLPGNCGLSVIRSTFDRNRIGLMPGGNQFSLGATTNYWSNCGSFNDLVFRDNDIAIYSANEGFSHYNNITITGSTNSPSGQSKAAIEFWNNNYVTYNQMNVYGTFSKGVFVSDSNIFNTSFLASRWTNSYPGAPMVVFDYSQGGMPHLCPGSMSCASLHQTRFQDVPLGCATGVIQVEKATYDYDNNPAHDVDCTPYVAAQCNGKTACTVNYNHTTCNSPTEVDLNNYYANGSATISCTGSTANQYPTNFATVYFVDTPEPNYIADVDNVTAGRYVASPQPTQNANAMFVDVTKHGVASDGTDQTAAIQSVINTATDGTVFYFPQGRYFVKGLDFSHLKNFTIEGDGQAIGGIRNGTTIEGTSQTVPTIKADYVGAAGTFQIRDVTLTGGSQTIYARNAVLSNIQDVQAGADNGTGIYLDNPFMVSIRSLSSGGSIGVVVNGGMRTTVENQDITGGNEYGYKSWGTDHSNFASRYEVQKVAGVEVGTDLSGTVHPSIGFSLAGLEEEANSVGVKIVNCQNCSLTSSQIYGHSLLGMGPNGTEAPDYYGLYLDDVDNSLVSGLSPGGYFWNSDLAVTGNASNILVADTEAHNAWAGCPSGCTSPGSATWVINQLATKIVLSATDKPGAISVPPTLTTTTTTPPPPSCTENWSCTAWSMCSASSTQMRTCTDLNACGTALNKPAITQSCTPTSTLNTGAFLINDRVKTTSKVNVRTSAQASGKPSGQQKVGALGTIVGGPTASGTETWWQVNFDTGADGYVTELYLAKVLTQ